VTRNRPESGFPIDLPAKSSVEVVKMAHDDHDDDWEYAVVVNHEQQYSIWPSGRAIPLGWHATGKTGRKDECLAYIESIWTDMRPLSLRRQAEEAGEIEKPLADGQEELGAADDREPGNHGPSLVERLSSGRHPVEAALRPERTATALKECIDREYMRLRFAQTRGPTELYMKLDNAASVTRLADFENAKGSVHLEGELTLDHVKVRCIVDLDVATLRGKGHLVPLVDQSRGTAPERR
jgi:uncharacterized protein YbdZ (MbtH family)